MMLLGIGFVQSVLSLKTADSPGISFPFPVWLARMILICKQGCMAKCWENSKYVSNCVESNEAQCLCEDTEFQSVRNPPPIHVHC